MVERAQLMGAQELNRLFKDARKEGVDRSGRERGHDLFQRGLDFNILSNLAHETTFDRIYHATAGEKSREPVVSVTGFACDGLEFCPRRDRTGGTGSMLGSALDAMAGRLAAVGAHCDTIGVENRGKVEERSKPKSVGQVGSGSKPQCWWTKEHFSKRFSSMADRCK
jgi:hypothetical protein